MFFYTFSKDMFFYTKCVFLHNYKNTCFFTQNMFFYFFPFSPSLLKFFKFYENFLFYYKNLITRKKIKFKLQNNLYYSPLISMIWTNLGKNAGRNFLKCYFWRNLFLIIQNEFSDYVFTKKVQISKFKLSY